MNIFLGGHFFFYGHQALQFTGLLEPGFKLFPGVAICEIFTYERGVPQGLTIMCLLPINILNSKIYAFLWFWFVFLFIVSCCALVCRCAFFLSPWFRKASLAYGKRHLDKKQLQAVVSQTSAVDCFLLYLISRNIGSLKFKEVVSRLAKEDLGVEKFSEDDENTLM
ncbi:hypothetical protein JTE90_010197 [Oedothorax gibbosus]|uniref:Innexin n=1 Tax=Oedothorax gibbosus TaxID=931172 RepID=A0AAV6UIB9_9ARAC|nr:hypothetical protein JTE90_010197 [Oedothorax gibbosus]